LQADLFKRFFRGDRHETGDTSVDAGAGLGLAIVHDIMNLHGGSVCYEDAAGGGARFVLRIPLAAAVQRNADAAQAAPASVHVPLG
jgi:signal transduction histidine kinase